MTKEFKDRIIFLKDEYDIKSSTKRTDNKNCCRIAIIITEAYLKVYKDSIKALFLERELYEELKEEYLICQPIHYETRSKELRHRDWNPLRIILSSREHETRSAFVEEIISILKEKGKENGNKIIPKRISKRVKIRKGRRSNNTRKPIGTLRSNKKCSG